MELLGTAWFVLGEFEYLKPELSPGHKAFISKSRSYHKDIDDSFSLINHRECNYLDEFLYSLAKLHVLQMWRCGSG